LQVQVLAMLYDLELSSISSRQLGQHAAHHLWSCIMQELSFMPDVEVTLQQVCGCCDSWHRYKACAASRQHVVGIPECVMAC
jgi:hypothetical protein